MYVGVQRVKKHMLSSGKYITLRVLSMYKVILTLKHVAEPIIALAHDIYEYTLSLCLFWFSLYEWLFCLVAIFVKNNVLSLYYLHSVKNSP